MSWEPADGGVLMTDAGLKLIELVSSEICIVCVEGGEVSAARVLMST